MNFLTCGLLEYTSRQAVPSMIVGTVSSNNHPSSLLLSLLLSFIISSPPFGRLASNTTIATSSNNILLHQLVLHTVLLFLLLLLLLGGLLLVVMWSIQYELEEEEYIIYNDPPTQPATATTTAAINQSPIIDHTIIVYRSVFSAAFLVGVDDGVPTYHRTHPTQVECLYGSECNQPVIDDAASREVCLRGRPQGGRAVVIVSTALQSTLHVVLDWRGRF